MPVHDAPGVSDKPALSPAPSFDAAAIFKNSRNGVVRVNDASGFFVKTDSGATGTCDIVTASSNLTNSGLADVRLSNGRSYTASVQFVVSSLDITLLTIRGIQDPAKTCQTIPLSDETPGSKVGQPLVEVTAAGGTWQYRSGVATQADHHGGAAGTSNGDTSNASIGFDAHGQSADAGSPILDARGSIVAIGSKMDLPPGQRHFAAPAEALRETRRLLQLYRQTRNSVVSIDISNQGNGSPAQSPSGFFIAPAKATTGVCEIATTASAVRESPTASVRFADGTTHRAEVVKLDAKKDIAVLRVEGIQNAEQICSPPPLSASEQAATPGQILLQLSSTGYRTLLAREYSRWSHITTNMAHFPLEDPERKALVADAGAKNINSFRMRSDTGGPVLDMNGTVVSMAAKFSGNENDTRQFTNPAGHLQQDINELRAFDPMSVFKEKRDSLVYVASSGDLGSGFFVSVDENAGGSCEIVTNKHVVGNDSTVSIELSSGKSFKADVVLSDPAVDLAVLRINGVGDLKSTCKTLTLAPGEEPVKSGQFVLQLTARNKSYWFRSGQAIKYDKLQDTASKADFPEQDMKRLNLRLSITAAQGDSGGPVLDPATGQVVSVFDHFAVWGHNPASTIPVKYVRQALDALHKPKAAPQAEPSRFNWLKKFF